MVGPQTLRRFARGAILAVGAFVAFAADAGAERIRVELDKYLLVKLDADADSVFVGNPAVADVIVQDPRRLFVLGLTPGETSLRVLDIDGKDVMVTNIVVIPIEQRSVTVNRNVPKKGAIELTYSCDPRCAQVRTPSAVEIAATAIGTQAPAAEDAGAAAAGAVEPLIPPDEEE